MIKQNKREIQIAFRGISETPKFRPLPITDFQINLYGAIKKTHPFIIGTLIKNQFSNIPPKYDQKRIK
jgi:hypothetical protein